MGGRVTILNLAYKMLAINMMQTNNRFLRGLLFLVLFTGGFSYLPKAQKIVYSEPEREDNRRTNFEIIGKVGANFLVFKNNRNENDISVYDNSMKLINRVKQTDMDDRWINVDFVTYPDFAWMIYQYQRKGIVYCMGVKIGADGKRITEPVELDTTKIGWSASNKIYSTIFSEDKKSIMVFKINSKNPNNFVFTTLLFNSQLEKKNKHRMSVSMTEKNDYFTDFHLDNQGDLVFGKFIRRSYSDNITELTMITKKSDQESFTLVPLALNDHTLDEIKIKVDNINKRYLFNALYYAQRRGNVEGLFTLVWDTKVAGMIRESYLEFDDELRKLAKGPDASSKMAFDDYSLTSVITKKDGGFILVGESMYTTSRGSTFDRWGNRFYNNPWSSPLDYYYWSPYSNPYNSFYYDRYYGSRNGSQQTRYHAENIMILSFDADGKMEWNNAVPKAQYDDETDGTISHQIMVTGGELHLLFNLYERRTLLLNDQSISPDGKITRNPTLKNLDREIDFLPRFGKQVSSKALVLPCYYRNSLTFAKIEF